MTQKQIETKTKEIYNYLFKIAKGKDSNAHAACIRGACDIMKALIITEKQTPNKQMTQTTLIDEVGINANQLTDELNQKNYYEPIPQLYTDKIQKEVMNKIIEEDLQFIEEQIREQEHNYEAQDDRTTEYEN